jgi:hypothetical protein
LFTSRNFSAFPVCRSRGRYTCLRAIMAVVSWTIVNSETFSFDSTWSFISTDLIIRKMPLSREECYELLELPVGRFMNICFGFYNISQSVIDSLICREESECCKERKSTSNKTMKNHMQAFNPYFTYMFIVLMVSIQLVDTSFNFLVKKIMK